MDALPTLYCPFPLRLHPYAESIESLATEWATQWGLLPSSEASERFVREAYWLLIGYSFPDVSFEDLRLTVDWNSWGFVLDDWGDESAASVDTTQVFALLGQLQAVLAEQPTLPFPEQGLLAALGDIWQRLRPRSTLAWRNRLRMTLRQSFHSYLWQARNRAEQRIPTIAEYMQSRGDAGAWMTYVVLYELFKDIPPGSWNARVRTLLRAANQTIVLANDLFSFQKEVAHADNHNLVAIVHHERGCTWDVACQLVAVRHNVEMRHYLALERRLLADTPPDHPYQQYATFARNFMRGNLAWSLVTPRYQAERAEPLAIIVAEARRAK